MTLGIEDELDSCGERWKEEEVRKLERGGEGKSEGRRKERNTLYMKVDQSHISRGSLFVDNVVASAPPDK